MGSSQDELKCIAKAPSEAEYWLVHLAARPQVSFYIILHQLLHHINFKLFIKNKISFHILNFT